MGDEMHNKLITFLLLLNFVTTLTVGYTIYTNNSHSHDLEIGEDYKKFKENVYQGLGLLMSGQSQLSLNQDRLNIDILRIHHFVRPHADEFYENCPECQLERQKILQEENGNITSSLEEKPWTF
jgi:Zn finger protein HypA/HybF involved in hydrogenase expression